MRVLLVEDDTATAQGIEMMLRSEGYVCDATDMGEDGLEIGKLYDYDIIILDLMLPDIDGYEVLRRLRAARVQTPILIRSGLNGLDDKLKGLGVGADDYLTKPFDKRELVARIQAIVRRSKGHSDSVIQTGKLSVNLDTRTVEVDKQPLHLTGKEYGILGTVMCEGSPGAWASGGGDLSDVAVGVAVLDRIAQNIAAAPDRFDVVLATSGRSQFLA